MWRSMLTAASVFSEVHNTVTELTMLGLSVILVVLGGLYMRQG